MVLHTLRVKGNNAGADVSQVTPRQPAHLRLLWGGGPQPPHWSSGEGTHSPPTGPLGGPIASRTTEEPAG